MSGVNLATIVGYLGDDPTARQVGSSTVSNFSVATSESWKDKDGQKQERTEWHRVTAWGKLAEICNTYLKKGSLVFVQGRIQTTKTEEGKYFTDIVIDRMQMLGGRREDSEPNTEKAPF